jgi:6-phosphogluconolactonase (cycloisomerase 2 family)
MPLSQGPVSAGQGFCGALAADRAGKFLYASCPSSNAHGNQIGVDELAGFRIDQGTGSLTPVPGSPINLDQLNGNQLNERAGSMVVSQDGRFLYMVVQGVLVFSIDQSTGAPALMPGSPFVLPDANTLDAGALAIAPSGKFLYLTQNGNAGRQGQIAVYSLDAATGIPSPVTGSPFKTAPLFFPDAIESDPLGRFVYDGGGVTGPNVDVQQVHSDGTLAGAPGSPFSSADTALFIAAEPTGKFLYVFAGIGSTAGVFAYRIDRVSGGLTPVAGSPFARGIGAGGLTVDQSGKFLYISTSHALLGFAIDAASGALTEIPGNSADHSGFNNGVVTIAF